MADDFVDLISDDDEDDVRLYYVCVRRNPCIGTHVPTCVARREHKFIVVPFTSRLFIV